MSDLIIEDVEVAGLSVSSNGTVPGTFAIGSQFSVTYDVRNIGSTSAGSSTAAVYMNVNGTLTRLDTNSTTSLSAGSQDTNETLSFIIPAGLAPGSYAVVIQADYSGSVSETNEGNNGFGFIINVVAPQLPDLIIEDVTVSGQSISQNEVVTTSFAPGETFSVSYDVRNQGPGSAASSTAAVYLVVNGVTTRMDTNSTISLSAGSQDTSETLSFVVPADLAPGNYGVIVIADDSDVLVETGGLNNSIGFVINVAQPQLPDLIVEDVQVAGQTISQNELVTSSFAPGDTFSVTYDVLNQGAGSAAASTAALYLVVNGVATRMDTNSTTSLTAGAQETTETLTFTVPVDLPPGNYGVIIAADDGDVLVESGGGNNLIGFIINVGAQTDSVRQGTDTAAALSAGVWQSGVINAEPISGDGITYDSSGGYVDKDWYRVTLSEDSIYTFDGRSISLSEGNVVISLYDQNGQLIQNIYGSGSTNYAEGSAPSFSFGTSGQTNATQTYYLAVSAGGAEPDWRTATGDFEVRFTDNGVVSTGPSTFTLSPATLNVGEDAGTASFTITRTNNVGSETIWFSTVRTEGSANNSDYQGQDTVAYTFANGVSSITVPVRIIDNLASEANETFAVWVQRNENDPFGTYEARSTFTIIDNDTGGGAQTFTLNADATSVTENDTTITFTVTRSGTNLPEATVYYSTLYGLASSLYGQDYEGAISQSVVFAAGSNTSAPFTIDINEDQIDENNETFDVMIGLSPNDGRSDAVAIRQITILDDDVSAVAAPVISAAIAPTTTFSVSSLGTNTYYMPPSIALLTGTPQSITAWGSISPISSSSSILLPNNGSVSFSTAGSTPASGNIFVTTESIVDSGLKYASDILAADVISIMKAGMDIGELANAFRAFFITLEGANNPIFTSNKFDEIFAYTNDSLSKKLGIFGNFVNLVERGGNIIDAGANWEARFFAEATDVIVGWGAEGIGGLTGGVVAGLSSGGIGTFAGVTAGKLIAGFVYDQFASDHVIREAEELWQALEASGSGGGSARASGTTIVDAIDLSNFSLDAEFYAAEHPEAQAAVDSGNVSNLLAYFIKFGIPAGHIAHSSAVPLDPATISINIAAFDPMSFGTPAVFTSGSGVLAGDNLSTDESSLAGLVNAQRGAGGALVIDDELTAVANRVARDWMDNNPDNALSAQNGGDPTTWIETLSTGENFRNAFDGVNWTNLVLNTGVRVAGAISGAATAQEAFALFAATAAGAAFMSDTNSRSIGVAEYAGLWIIVTSDVTLQNDATVNAELMIARQFGTDSAEVMFAGTGPGSARLGGGSDAYFGGRFNDTVRGEAGEDQIFGREGSDVLNGGLGNDTLFGGDNNDELYGGESNDTLCGDAGVDRLVGGLGDDTYITDGGDTIVEGANGGTDTVLSSVTYTLGAALENLTLTGTAAMSAIGSGLANTLTGNSAKNTLNGGGGTDRMIGGGGDDTYITDGGDTIIEAANGGTDIVLSSVSYTLSSTLENLSLTGTTNINAIGNALANSLAGNSGNNTLNGGGGIDRMAGGLGDDTYVTDGGDIILEAASAGTDLVISSVSYTLATVIENLTLTGTDNINAIGNVTANRLTGNSGNNTLNGAGGIDQMAGGLGNDTYVSDGGDSIAEAANAGIDIVISSVSYTLGANLENLSLTGTTNINAIGNTLANSLAGNSGNNTLNGGGGIDRMAGGLGDDTYVTDGGDTILEASSAGTDTVLSSVSYTLGTNLENLTLAGTATITGTGNTVANVIIGNSASNTLNGGGGNDQMIGGLGNDVFVFNTALSAGNIDRITDFNVIADTIHLENAVFIGLANNGLTSAAFQRNLTGNAADASDRIIYETDTGNLYFDRDGTGAAAKVHLATLSAGLALTNADFFVF